MAPGNTDSTNLAPKSGFDEQQKNLCSSSFTIDYCTSLILEQPNFDHLEGVKDLQRHQKESKSTAGTWCTDVRSALYVCNDAILAYNSQFNSFYYPLLEFAKLIDRDEEARKNLVLGLIELKNEIKTQQGRVISAGNKLKEFHGSMQHHEADLEGDYTSIKATYESDHGRIHDIENAIHGQEAAMDKDLTQIGLESGGIVVGALAVAVGVVMWIESAGGSTPVVLGGIIAVASCSTLLGLAIKDYNNCSDRKAEMIKELSTIKSEITVAKALMSGVNDLTGHIKKVIDAADQLSAAWTQLEIDYDSLIDALNKTDPGKLSFVVIAHMNTAKDRWTSLAEYANGIKENLLHPLQVDDSAVKNAKPGDSSRLLLTHATTALFQPRSNVGSVFALETPNVTSKNIRLKWWVDETSRAWHEFEHSLDNAKAIVNAPSSVSTANEKLNNSGKTAVKTAGDFLASIEQLSNQVPILNSTAGLSDEAIITASIHVFENITKQLSINKKAGSTALSEVGKFDLAGRNTVAAINGWLSSLKIEGALEKAMMAEFERLRDEAEAEKKRSKEDFWWCFLGPIACAVVAIEQSQKENRANEKIRVLNDQLNKTFKKLQNVAVAYLSVNKLDTQATGLSHNIDGILKALEVIFVSVDGIIANYHSATPFIIRSHLKAIADQISNLGSTRLEATGRQLHFMILETKCHNDKIRMSDLDDHNLLNGMQNLTRFTLNIKSAARLTSSQPKLIFVENLLRQDQELLLGHAFEWLFTYSSKVISVLSHFRGFGSTFGYLGPLIRKFIVANDATNVLEGLDSIDSDLKQLKQFVFEVNLVCAQFSLNVSDDHLRFNTVSNVLRTQLGGKSSQLQALEDEEGSLAADLSHALDDVVNASTKMLIHNLEWGAVIAISLAFGQIEFAAAEGAATMNVIKKGANLALKKISKFGAKTGASQIKKIQDDQDKLTPIIEKRAQVLKDLSTLKVDMAILHLLLQSVNDLYGNASQLKSILSSIADLVADQISHFYFIRVLIMGGNYNEGLKIFDASMEEWKLITSAVDTLEQTYFASF